MAKTEFQEDAEIIAIHRYRGDYFYVRLRSPKISAHTGAGQFVHFHIPNSPELTLRRPFSIYDTAPDEGSLAIIFKVVGKGTAKMATLDVGQPVSLIGPLGHGFPAPVGGHEHIIIVAGGYGCAATYLIAKHAGQSGVCLLGARSKDDILVEEEFARTGFQVRVSTNDGSSGHQGLVTELLQHEFAKHQSPSTIYACGPNAMLKAVGSMCLKQGGDAYLSFDMPMCCGVGACFTCVLKTKAANREGWEYTRSCRFGPVFKASEIYWDD